MQLIKKDTATIKENNNQAKTDIQVQLTNLTERQSRMEDDLIDIGDQLGHINTNITEIKAELHNIKEMLNQLLDQK